MTVEISNNQAVFRWNVHQLQGQIFIGRAVQVEDCEGGIFYRNVDSLNIGLLISVHFDVTSYNAVSDQYHCSSFMSPFPVQPEGLITSDGKTMVSVQVRLLDAGHVNIICI